MLSACCIYLRPSDCACLHVVIQVLQDADVCANSSVFYADAVMLHLLYGEQRGS